MAKSWFAVNRVLTLVSCVGAARAIAPRAVDAQRVSGVVRERDANAPIAGAVVSLLDSAGRLVSRTITDQRGALAVLAGSPVRQIRAIRIGFRPFSEKISQPADTTIAISLERIPVQLEAVRVSSEATCDASATTRTALELWDQARSALLAAIVAREEKPAQVSTMTYERRYEPRRGLISQQRTLLTSGQSRRPFLSRPAETLAREGYMVVDQGQDVFTAPDADVLFDESFLLSHCFGVRVGDQDHPGLIGMTFEPRAGDVRDSIVDVAGVLWLDATGPSLMELDYRYTHVPELATRAGSGGRVHFQSISNGVTFVDEWSITLPVLQNVVVRHGTRTEYAPALLDVSESGGFVTAAHWNDGTTWRARRISAMAGQIVNSDGLPVTGAIVAITGMTEVLTDALGEFSFTSLPAGRYKIAVTDTTDRVFLRPRAMTREVVVGSGDTARVEVGMAGRSALIEALCKKVPAASQVILGEISDGTGVWPKSLVVESVWQDQFIKAGDDGLMVKDRSQSIDVDDGGRFHVCGAARERPTRLRAVVGRVVVADTVLHASPDTVRFVRWLVRPGTFTGSQLGDGSGLGDLPQISRAASAFRSLPSATSSRMRKARSICRWCGRVSRAVYLTAPR